MITLWHLHYRLIKSHLRQIMLSIKIIMPHLAKLRVMTGSFEMMPDKFDSSLWSRIMVRKLIVVDLSLYSCVIMYSFRVICWRHLWSRVIDRLFNDFLYYVRPFYCLNNRLHNRFLHCHHWRRRFWDFWRQWLR